MIGIASLGMGNISAITNIYDDYDIKYVILRSSKDYEKKINKIILPGVSSFDEAMASIIEKDFDNLLKDFCRNKNNFLLGICVGMQVLGNTSEEGVLNGLIAIEWGAYGVPESFLIYDKKIIKKVVGPLNNSLVIEIEELIK